MLKMSAVCFLALITLAVIGESIMPLYGGDKDLAARGSIASFTLLGGVSFACLQPTIWAWFAVTLQRVIAFGGSEAKLADHIQSARFPMMVSRIAQVFCIVILAATLFLTYHFWNGNFFQDFDS